MLLRDWELTSSLELDLSLRQSELHLQNCTGAVGTEHAWEVTADCESWPACTESFSSFGREQAGPHQNLLHGNEKSEDIFLRMVTYKVLIKRATLDIWR